MDTGELRWAPESHRHTWQSCGVGGSGRLSRAAWREKGARGQHRPADVRAG